MLRLYLALYPVALAVLGCVTFAPALSEPAGLTLNLRSRAAVPGKQPVAPTER